MMVRNEYRRRVPIQGTRFRHPLSIMKTLSDGGHYRSPPKALRGVCCCGDLRSGHGRLAGKQFFSGSKELRLAFC